MYKISLIRDAALQKQLSDRCGIADHPGFPAVSIETEKGYVGIIPFYIDGGKGILRCIGALPGAVEEDFEPFFVAGRQVLNLLDQCGAHDGYLLEIPPNKKDWLPRSVLRRQTDSGIWICADFSLNRVSIQGRKREKTGGRNPARNSV